MAASKGSSVTLDGLYSGIEGGGNTMGDTDVTEVILLQSTSRSSLSSHWAIEVRGEVFELNQGMVLEPSRHSPHSLGLGQWAKVVLIQAMLTFYSSLVGIYAQIDTSTSTQYAQHLGEHTMTRTRLGVTRMSQHELKNQIRKRNGLPMFYSAYTSNCQHFILDLCDLMDLQLSTSAFRSLRLKSRLTYLGACLLNFIVCLITPFVTRQVFRHGTSLQQSTDQSQPGVLPPYIEALTFKFLFIFSLWIQARVLLHGLKTLGLTTADEKIYIHGPNRAGSSLLRTALLSYNGPAIPACFFALLTFLSYLLNVETYFPDIGARLARAVVVGGMLEMVGLLVFSGVVVVRG